MNQNGVIWLLYHGHEPRWGSNMWCFIMGFSCNSCIANGDTLDFWLYGWCFSETSHGKQWPGGSFRTHFFRVFISSSGKLPYSWIVKYKMFMIRPNFRSLPPFFMHYQALGIEHRCGKWIICKWYTYGKLWFSNIFHKYVRLLAGNSVNSPFFSF